MHIGTAATVLMGLTDESDFFGTSLGSVDLVDADEGSILAITLNAAGLGYINAHVVDGTPLIFGGKVSTLAKTGGVTEEVFSLSDSSLPVVMLELETLAVPLPASAWLFVNGLLGLIAVSRTRRGSGKTL